MADGFLAGAMPGVGRPHADEAAIRAAGLGTVIDLTGASPSADLSFPIEDFGVPDVPTMRRILDAIDHHRSDGVYVHCLGGIGRTGTVAGCWLIRHGLETRGTTIDGLARRRAAERVTGLVPSPETDQQTAMVLDWEAGD